MLEVLVAQYPLSDVWALPGVRAGGNQQAQKGLGRQGWPNPMAGCPAEKGETQMGVTALSKEVPLPPPTEHLGGDAMLPRLLGEQW